MTSGDGYRSYRRRPDAAEITVAFGGRTRTFRFDAGRLAVVGVALGAIALVYLGATSYLLFRDDILTGSIERQMRQERAYEDRIAALRGEVDRINGRRLIDQDAFEAKIDTLLARQTRLGEAQSKIGALFAKVGELGLKPSAAAKASAKTSAEPAVAPAAPAAAPDAASPAAPAPFDAGGFAVPLRSSGLLPLISPAEAAESRDPATRIAAVEKAIDAIERRQAASVGGLADFAETRAQTWTRALARVGFKIAEPASSLPLPAPRPAAAEATGGPYVPLLPEAMSRAEGALGRLARLETAARRLPLARPLPGDPPVTSDFGARLDPFLGIGAMHTGIDFRADEGEPVRVTGPGVVVASGRQGGYGNCVDVDHGNGVVTRYGHLSSLSVAVGDKVAAGDVIGLAGSTGRSTGPHLHYETRVAGEPVDPKDWLEAGRTLGF